ncbi:MAG: 1-deoxy-D-xylulose-5-phosphate reductoisomerase [Acidobacteria bacterium]|nr:1-deoxy-D-xylulose-5-phosphate reductoisomerase [Acidobacteriota bacterium]
MKKISILGSTGSIGRSTLKVVASHPHRFAVTALAARRNVDLLCRQVEEFRPQFVAVGDEAAARAVERRFPGIGIGIGEEGLCAAAAGTDAGIVLVAVVGAAGLLPTLKAIDAGKDIALANKETLVVAGRLVIDRARARGCKLLPVDSEHSALFQCIHGRSPDEVKNIVLTASGGPFRESPGDALAAVTPEQALRHPTWQMGPKITIDSATLMNKGLEVIEAHFLFEMPPDRIKVVIHPQSIVHSMVEMVDGSLIAQLGMPDMRSPIQYALSYPERFDCETPRMDFSSRIALTFDPPSPSRFPCLRLAYEAIEQGGTAPAVLNAANEIAVAAFLEDRIGFLQIPATIEAAMEAVQSGPIAALDELLAVDAEARRAAERYVTTHAGKPAAHPA